MAKIKWGQTVKDSLKLSINPKLWLWVFAFVLSYFAFYLFFGVIPGQIFIFATSQILISVLFFILIFLFDIWIIGMIVHQSFKQKGLKNSFRDVKKVYLSLLGVKVSIAAISIVSSFLLGFVPVVGPLLGLIAIIIIALIFMFAVPIVVVEKCNFSKALKGSWQIFKKKTLTVFGIWLVLLLMSFLILIPFVGVPFVILLVSTFASLISFAESLIILQIFMLIGWSVFITFMFSAITKFYLQIRKKRLF